MKMSYSYSEWNPKYRIHMDFEKKVNNFRIAEIIKTTKLEEAETIFDAIEAQGYELSNGLSFNFYKRDKWVFHINHIRKIFNVQDSGYLHCD